MVPVVTQAEKEEKERTRCVISNPLTKKLLTSTKGFVRRYVVLSAYSAPFDPAFLKILLARKGLLDDFGFADHFLTQPRES